MELNQTHGIVSRASSFGFDETIARLTSTLQSKGILLFAVIDHSGEAAKVGMAMPKTKLVIFGNPKAGTPLMLAEPNSAIDLPLKILVREDEAGKAWLSYNSPDYLIQRHHLPKELMQNIAAIAGLVEAAAG